MRASFGNRARSVQKLRHSFFDIRQWCRCELCCSLERSERPHTEATFKMSLTRSAVAVVENSGRRCVSSFLCAAATRGEQSALKPSRTTASVSTRSTPRQVTTSRSFTTATAAQLLRNSSSSSSASHDLSETPSHAPDSDEDVVIIGGGVVGLSLACSLVSSRSFASSGNSLTLIEASDLDKLRTWADAKQQRREQAANEERPSAEDGIDWENRVIYLTEENRAWLDGGFTLPSIPIPSYAGLI